MRLLKSLALCVSLYAVCSLSAGCGSDSSTAEDAGELPNTLEDATVADSGTGGEQTDADVTDECEDLETPLSVNAGEDITAALGESIALSPSIASSLMETDVTWSGDGLTFSSTTTGETSVTADAAGTYTATITVTNACDEVADDSVELTFTEETGPAVEAGGNQRIRPGQTTTVQAVVERADNIEWTKTSGPGTVTFGDAASAETTVTIDSEGSYVLQVSVSDGVTTASDTLTIDVVADGAALNLIMIGNGNTQDQAIRDLLNVRGHTVQILPANSAPGDVLDGHDAVLISSSIISDDLDSGWGAVELPMLVWEAYAYPQLGLTADDPTQVGDEGVAEGTDLTITDDTHPLAAGLSGIVHLSEAGWTFANTPGAEAIVIGDTTDTSGDSKGVGYFAYEAAATMPGGSAPARRVALPLGLDLSTTLTADAKDILEAALAWAVDDSWFRRTRVMPLGDSITRGQTIAPSYRQPLASLLDDAGCSYDLVGTERLIKNSATNQINAEPTVVYDWDHEGHGGYTASQIGNELDSFLLGNVPNVVMMHLGTNDLLQGVSNETSRTHLTAIIAGLRAANPDVTILLATIVPGTHEDLADAVAPYNTMVTEVAEAEDSDASPIILVDQNSGFDTSIHLLSSDGIHPTPEGDAQIASQWFDALAPFLSCSAP